MLIEGKYLAKKCFESERYRWALVYVVNSDKSYKYLILRRWHGDSRWVMISDLTSKKVAMEQYTKILDKETETSEFIRDVLTEYNAESDQEQKEREDAYSGIENYGTF